VSSYEELRLIALAEFARMGYAGTSLQHVADIAGLSKSSVLYHFSSKEALLEAAVSPAINRIEAILLGIEGASLTGERQKAFIVAFVDFLLEHRLEVNTFINHGALLEDVPVMHRANALVGRLATYFHAAAPTVEARFRFGIALGGAAYMLAAPPSMPRADESPDDEIRVALITIMTELLAPVPVRPAIP
jgi:TetR/AcrR family transcriptional regulator